LEKAIDVAIEERRRSAWRRSLVVDYQNSPGRNTGTTETRGWKSLITSYAEFPGDFLGSPDSLIGVLQRVEELRKSLRKSPEIYVLSKKSQVLYLKFGTSAP
jgi:hypothetical protein